MTNVTALRTQPALRELVLSESEDQALELVSGRWLVRCTALEWAWLPGLISQTIRDSRILTKNEIWVDVYCFGTWREAAGASGPTPPNQG
jgi:hypothetical protein